MSIKNELLTKKRRSALAFIAAVSMLLTGCIKDEPLNAECDITDAYVSVSHPEEMFFHASDTLVHIGSEESIIQFTVRRTADLTQLSPRFLITEGATITPANGSVHDFSQGLVTYTVTSQDKQWSRQYQVSFHPVSAILRMASH